MTRYVTQFMNEPLDTAKRKQTQQNVGVIHLYVTFQKREEIEGLVSVYIK